MIRVARTALLAPLMVAGGLLTLTFSSVNVFAASSSVKPATHAAPAAPQPESSSRKHRHENVDCDPGRISEKDGHCKVVFTDKVTKSEPSPEGKKVCFSVEPETAGSISPRCSKIGENSKAVSTFTASGSFCGKAVITAREGNEHQSHHTTIRITCRDKDAATLTAALIPTGSPSPPAGTWLLGVMGVGVALVTGYAIRTRRWFSPWRLAA